MNKLFIYPFFLALGLYSNPLKNFPITGSSDYKRVHLEIFEAQAKVRQISVETACAALKSGKLSRDEKELAIKVINSCMRELAAEYNYYPQ